MHIVNCKQGKVKFNFWLISLINMKGNTIL